MLLEVKISVAEAPFLVVTLVAKGLPLNLRVLILITDLLVCNKFDHIALQCYYKFEHSYQYDAPRQLFANYTSSNALVDTTWYLDLATTHHITNELSNLNVSFEPYTGVEAIRVENDSGIPIHHLGSSTFFTSSSIFSLYNLLHVSAITKNLVFVLCFCIDNSCFF